MALVHPGKPRAASFARKAKVQKEMHPAMGLLFGIVILLTVAFTVHNIFHFIF